MEKVYVIRVNDNIANVCAPVQESLKNSQKKCYYVNADEKRLCEINDRGIILFIFYDKDAIGQKRNPVTSLYIGTVCVNDKVNLEYTIYCRIDEKKGAENAIAAILDKIDLDIVKDFDSEKSYLKVSTMKNLYMDLHERVCSCRNYKSQPFQQEQGQEQDYLHLNRFAQKNNNVKKIFNEESMENRTWFQRDRERIVNCQTFRRMVDKAQIFSGEKGDHYRTRLTHTLEVNQIAKAIASALGLNLDLTEAIALGHDLGHTPFGHQGERTLDDILRGKVDVGICFPIDCEKKNCFGGFKHNYQSMKVLTILEEKYVPFSGLNVNLQVIDGVLKHTKIKSQEEMPLEDFLPKEIIPEIDLSVDFPKTLEGQAVAIADEIAQRGHDVDDALTSGVMTVDELIDRLAIDKCDDLKHRILREKEDIEMSERLLIDRKKLLISRIVNVIVGYFINDVIDYSNDKLKHKNDEQITVKIIDFSEDVGKVNSYLERVVQKKVICNNEVARADYNASMVIQALFRKYYQNPRLLHEGTIHRLFVEMLQCEVKNVAESAVDLTDGSIEIVNREIENITRGDAYISSDDDLKHMVYVKRKILIRTIVDYIAGMTDGYAMMEYEKLL